MVKYNRKIAFVVPIYLPANLSGSEVAVRDIAEELAEEGYDVSIITSNALTARYWYDPIFGKKIRKKNEIINGVKVYRMRCNQILSSLCFVLVRYFGFFLPNALFNKLNIIYNGPCLLNIYDFLNKEKFDIIDCSPFPLYINKQIADNVSKLAKKPKLIFKPHFHSQVSEFNNPDLLKILNHADIIHVVSNAEKKEINKTFKVGMTKFKVIPLFLKVHNMYELDEITTEIKIFKEKYELSNRKVILFAGNKGKMKGAIQLLFAINDLYKKDSSYILVAIGNNTLEWEMAKKNVDSNCILDFNYVYGKMKEIIFGACDIFCMPSKSESFGLVYIEAWHKKKPVIAADFPETKELINDCGLLVEFNNETDLMESIEKLANDDVLAKELGHKGYYRLMSKYECSKIFDKYLDLFDLN